jgi:putative ABC transport system permease protein
MKLIDIFRTANANILRSKLRTSLTIIAIFIGAFTLTLTNGIGSGISSYIDKQLNNIGAKDVLVIQAAGQDSNSNNTSTPKEYDPSQKVSATAFGTTTVVLTDADIDKIKQVPGIKSVTPNLVVTPDFISGKNGKKFQLSVNPYISGTNIDLAAGSAISNDDPNPTLLVPLDYVSALGYSSNEAILGQTVTIGITDGTGEQHQVTGVVKGVQQKSLTNEGGASINQTLTNQLYQQQIIGLPPATTNSYEVLVAKFDPSFSDTQITDLKNQLKGKGYKAQTVEDQLGTFKSVVNGIVLVLNVFAIIALLAASFGIVNTLLMSVQERTKEIGLMKAMGMSSGKIFLLFSTEAMTLGFWGSLIGVLVATAVGNVVNHIVSTGLLKDLPGLSLLAFPIVSLVGIVLLVIVIALLAGTLPAWRAARQSPIDSLRYE